jgi:hypothetical protein
MKIDKENKMHLAGKKYKTDKVFRHEYHKIYPQFIEKFYNISGGIIEIGLKAGASLKMWLEIFPKMHIYALDRDPKVFPLERHTTIKADQSSKSDLQHALSIIQHPIYFINDDGSHIPDHQVLTFNVMFPKLESGGVYIIEDIETSYWKNRQNCGYSVNYGLNHPKSCIEKFKNVIDGVNYNFSKTYPDSGIQHQEQISSVTFAKNCIVIIKK